MKGTMIACDLLDGRKAAALVIDGQLEDLIVDPLPGALPLPGTIFSAIADRPMKGQGGLFVKLPNGANGFLRQGKALRPGQKLLVQVTGFAEPGKAVPVTSKLLFKGRYVIVTPGAPGVNVSRKIRDDDRRTELTDMVARECPDAKGVILRSSAQDAHDDALATELLALHALASQVSEQDFSTAPGRVLDGPDAHHVAGLEWSANDTVPLGFAEAGIDDMVALMQDAHVDLKGGATAWVEPTRALVAVDVNTGGDSTAAAGLKANIALCRDLPRQLRCRGLGGQIVIDFAPVAKRDRRHLEQALRSSFRNDAIETALVGWTPLGHFELQRKRERLAIS